MNLRDRFVSALTLFSFTATTISPSLAWAADREEIRRPARFVDEVESSDVQSPKEAVEPGQAADELTVPKERPDTDELQKAVTTDPVKKPAADTPVETDATETAALPTGADKSGVTSQAISVPKGSGTIQGMGESFSAQLSTGIATFSVPFALPAARGGAQPSLGLSYSSASGAGLAGMGWSVGVPFIARQTDRGLPGYDDQAQWHANQDRFVFNGGQELVPICLVKSATSCIDPLDPKKEEKLLPGEQMPGWAAGSQYFRPRVEGSFLRFFWSSNHLTWRVQDKSGVTMELGVPLDGSGSRTALETNPDSKEQIYRWHLVRQYDTYGATSSSVNPGTAGASPTPYNVVVYRYFQDGGQAYLSDIYDTTPTATPATTLVSNYAHHTHLEYEPRSDPTESYRSGWAMQQTQRLKRVDVTSRTFEEGAEGPRRLVRRYHLDYDTRFHVSYLASVQVEGRCATVETAATPETDGMLGATRCVGVSRADNVLPPMTFDYSHVAGFTTAGGSVESSLDGYEAFDARLQQIGGDPPHSVDEELTDYFDIDSDGLPDVLVTAPGIYGDEFGVFFNSEGGEPRTFGAVTQLGVAGVLGANSGSIKLSNQNVAPLDFDGDGIVDFLHMPKVKTYSAYTPKLVGSKWKLVGRAIDAASKQSPKIDLGKDAAETRVADVNFDGLVDVVVSTGTEFQTFLSLGRLPEGAGQFGHGSWTSSAAATLSNDPVSKCVPYSGSPVRFSDPDIQLADMNGDGIQDILRLRQGDFRYWPGRGNGYWGTGKLDDCPAGSFGDKRYVRMDDAPYFSDIQGTSLRVDDVNGDGLDDLVQVRFDAVDVWLNVDGKSWTKRSIIDGTPESPSFANRVRLMDINGSGTRDVVWGNGKKYQFMDLAGGARPGVLVRVENGLGKSTDIEYSSSTDEMLAAERTGTKCGGSSDFARAWCSKMPTVTHVVKRVTESDNLSVAGSGKSKYVTEYSYRDPVYDGRQREFRGFRQARSKRIGDANSPTDLTESTFLLGECKGDCEVWQDNPREALKGLPVVTERFDEAGKYLSTEGTTYRLRHLYQGLDRRGVYHAFERLKRATSYDTAEATRGATSTASAAVEREEAATAALTSLEAMQCTVTALPKETLSTDASDATAIPLRASTGYATIESRSYVDAFGNRVIAVAEGCVEGSACPTAATGLAADEWICSFTVPTAPTGETSKWLFRTGLSWVRGSANTDARKKTSTTFNDFGAPTSVLATLKGTAPLKRGHAVAGRQWAPDPSTRSADSPNDTPSINLGTQEYDAHGNLTKETGPNGRCRTILYEDEDSDSDSYALFALKEAVYLGDCAAEDAAKLDTSADYDAGLGLVTSVRDMTGQQSFVRYDGFGRLTALYRPDPDSSELDPDDSELDPDTLPSVKISYDLPPPGSGRAYSIIHTETQDGKLVTDNEYLESYSYVDGMGRARVGLAEADPSADEDNAHWIVSTIAEFDAKGAVQRKFLPFYFSETEPSGFPVADTPPNVQYGRQRYDAFGRQVQTTDVDGTVTLQSRYHALSTDLYDAADLYPGPHQGSYASTRSDGHGRTVATTERVHEGGVVEAREVRTTYLPTGEPVTITRVRVDKPSPPVTRWMRYDSLGRLVVNADPHATVFTGTFPGPADYTDALKTWRYAYNDAGDLVGTSDARMCGQNFFYDNAGRLTAEDYSPCADNQALYSAPVSGSGYGFEVIYQYDSVPADYPNGIGLPGGWGDGDDDYSPASPTLKGRLVAVHDRAATTWFKYDARGRVIETARKVAKHDLTVTSPQRYRGRWYYKQVQYDAADRTISETTGATQLLGANSKSAVTTEYTHRGDIKKVGSSYHVGSTDGALVKRIDRDAEGKVGELTFGDAAETKTHSTFDSRRRLASVQTYRGTPALWSSDPPAYSPAPAPSGDPPTTFQLLLQDLDYKYDVVNNPVEIRDWRSSDEWPAGAKPASRRMEYDDLYRVTRVDYEYPGGTDKMVAPFAPEMAGQSDPRRPPLVGHKIFPKRPTWQTYRYDWLGNTTRTDDDRHAFYDRSLGDIGHTAAGKPYQLTTASQPTTAGPDSGSVSQVTYDAAGNLTGIRVARTATECDSPGACTLDTMKYQWDEVGRLYRAEHTEGAAGTNPIFFYLYDYNDERVVREDATLAQRKQTLYVFDSLEIRGTQLDTATPSEYILNGETEVPYLSANGMRLGRVVKEPAAGDASFKDEPQLSQGSELPASLHVFLTLPDHLGSTSLVVDMATSELVEARTYQPYGATESDYRPERWKGFREDYGFTGKEEDVEVGLQYFGKRYLSPYLGRWISADPLAIQSPGQADFNVYAYVKGGLLRLIDPIGLDPLDFGIPPPVGDDGVALNTTRGAKAIIQWEDDANGAGFSYIDGATQTKRNTERQGAYELAGRRGAALGACGMAGTAHAVRKPPTPPGLNDGMKQLVDGTRDVGVPMVSNFNTELLETTVRLQSTILALGPHLGALKLTAGAFIGASIGAGYTAATSSESGFGFVREVQSSLMGNYVSGLGSTGSARLLNPSALKLTMSQLSLRLGGPAASGAIGYSVEKALNGTQWHGVGAATAGVGGLLGELSSGMGLKGAANDATSGFLSGAFGKFMEEGINGLTMTPSEQAVQKRDDQIGHHNF